MDKFEIVKKVSTSRRGRLLTRAQNLAVEMARTAVQITKAVEAGDLQRLVWLTKQYDATLAAVLEQTHEDEHLIAGLEK